jgi:GntR family transcriptional repressor for pyruvate dehydrogenase complex
MTDFVLGENFRRDRTGAADQVLNDLRSRILSGQFVRGARLPSEKELAVHYEVSAPTIREAVRALSAIGLVDVRHGSGSYVTADASSLMASAMTAVVELEGIDLLSILDLSESLYAQAVSIAIDRAEPGDVTMLRSAAAELEAAQAASSIAGALRGFLTALVAISHNRLLEAMATYLVETQISIVEGVVAESPEAWERIAGNLVQERAAIVDAVEQRNRPAASDAVRVYMARARGLVRSYAKVT